METWLQCWTDLAPDVPRKALYVGNLQPVNPAESKRLERTLGPADIDRDLAAKTHTVWSCSTLFTPKIVGSYGCSSTQNHGLKMCPVIPDPGSDATQVG